MRVEAGRSEIFGIKVRSLVPNRRLFLSDRNIFKLNYQIFISEMCGSLQYTHVYQFVF